MPILIPFIAGAWIVHAIHTSAQHAAMRARHEAYEARLATLEARAK